MIVIFSLVLIALGIVSAQNYIGSKAPTLRSTIDKMNANADYIGLAGLLIGIIWLLDALSLLRLMDLHPFIVLLALASALLTLLLGLMFSLPVLHKFMNEPTPAVLLQADKLTLRLQPYRRQLGIAAIVLGILCIF